MLHRAVPYRPVRFCLKKKPVEADLFAQSVGDNKYKLHSTVPLGTEL